MSCRLGKGRGSARTAREDRRKHGRNMGADDGRPGVQVSRKRPESRGGLETAAVAPGQGIREEDAKASGYNY